MRGKKVKMAMDDGNITDSDSEGIIREGATFVSRDTAVRPNEQERGGFEELLTRNSNIEKFQQMVNYIIHVT